MQLVFCQNIASVSVYPTLCDICVRILRNTVSYTDLTAIYLGDFDKFRLLDGLVNVICIADLNFLGYVGLSECARARVDKVVNKVCNDRHQCC